MRALLLIPAAMLAGAAGAAQPAAAPDQVARVAAASAPAIDSVDLASDVEEQMQAYIDKSGLGDRADRGDLQVLHHSASVTVSTSDPRWVAFRAMAYKEALLDAAEDFVKAEGETVDNEITHEFYNAAHQEPPPFDKGQEPGQAAELIRKLLAVGNAQLDGELQKLGVDPKSYEAAPEPQKHLQLRNALTQETMRRAFADIVGLTPVQTFEGNDGKGDYQIGVVAVVSPKLRDFAQEVLRAHGEFEPDPAKAQDLKTLFGGDKAKLLCDFGVRRMFDRNGLPVIVSFAQWAPEGSSGDDPSVLDSYREVAFSQAESQADAQIADFLAGSAQFDSKSEVGQSLEKMAERLPDDYIKQDAATHDLVDGMFKSMQARSHISLTGIETVRRWTMAHPVTGRPVVGIIRMWSAAREKQVRALRDGRGGDAGASAADAPREDATVRTGNDYMKATDF
jgi:hypothetical protein